MRKADYRTVLCTLPFLLFCGLSRGAVVAGPFSTVRAVTDAELTGMRGGILLPDGLNIDLGIDIQTQVNGVLVLHTVLSTAAPPADQLRVFSGGTNPRNAPATTVTPVAAVPPTLILNRPGSSTTLVPSVPLNTSVVVLNAPTNVWPQYPDETRLDVVPNGSAVQTAAGAVQVLRTGDNTAVTLTGSGLTVQHLLGDATGATVANQLNNQAIQTMTIVDVDLHGSWPAVANSMFNVGNVALAAIRRY